MLYGLKKVVRYVLGADIAGRSLAVRPDDTFVVSYPRSGNTWIRFLIANLLYPHESGSFANIERLIPDCEAHSSRYLKRLRGPRVIKSHEYFDHRYQKVIYIVRDPRDVVLSYFNFQRKYRQIPDNYPLEQFTSDFVAGRLSSADWGTWGQHVGSWLCCDGRPGFLVVRYEDLTSNALHELSRIARFFGIEPGTELLAAACQRSSASRMRALERSESSQWVATRNRREDIPFVGKAASGRWREQLSPTSVAEIESAWAPLMASLGYEIRPFEVEHQVTSRRNL